nr:MAG TPA: hypothetical protein [Caudoviricetes sp.]
MSRKLFQQECYYLNLSSEFRINFPIYIFSSIL